MTYYVGMLGLSICLVCAVLLGGQLINALWTGHFLLADATKVERSNSPGQFLSLCILYGFFAFGGVLGLIRLVPLFLDST